MSSGAKSARETFFKSATLEDGMKTLRKAARSSSLPRPHRGGKDHSGELTANIDRTNGSHDVKRAIENVKSACRMPAYSHWVKPPFVGLSERLGHLNAITATALRGSVHRKGGAPVGIAVNDGHGLAVAAPRSATWMGAATR